MYRFVTMPRLVAGAVAALAAGGCGPALATHVHADQLGLGKVVVYRNGVAFYERHARVKGGTLTVGVPRDRVDDFLKSLTVVDAISGQPLPVSFPRQQSADGAVIEMTLQVPIRADEADVRLTYVTEAPAWKPSYRLAMADDGSMMLEGWAVVDNVSGEDWKQVEIGVGSSAAMSFRYDLWGVRTVDRAELAPAEQFAVAPPMAVAPYGGSGEAQATIIDLSAGELRSTAINEEDARKVGAMGGGVAAENTYVVEGVNTTGLEYGARPKPVPMTEPAAPADPSPAPMSVGSGRSSRQYEDADESYAAVTDDDSGGGSGDGGRDRPPPPPDPAVLARAAVAAGDRKLEAAVPALIAQKAFVVVEGYAAPGEVDGDQRALARAHLVRNQLIDAGIAPARIRAVSKGVAPGRGAGVQLVSASGPGETAPSAHATTAGIDPGAPPVGESYFMSAGAITVGAGTSAMVSVLRETT